MTQRFGSVAQRVGDLVRQKVRAAVWPSEPRDPVRLLHRTFDEIAEAEAEAERDLGRAIAEAQRIGRRDQTLAQENAARLEEATQALAGGRDDLARVAVGRLIELEADRAELGRLASANTLATKECDAALMAIRRRKRDLRIEIAEFERSRPASPRSSCNLPTSALTTTPGGGRLADIRITERDHDSQAALQELAALTHAARVEDRLARLKSGSA